MLTEIFSKPKPILGPVHLLALPGTPGWHGDRDKLIARAEQEASALATGGVDGLIVENRYDGPFPASDEHTDPAAAIAMAMLVRRLQQLTGLPVGISLLQNDPETALAVALNTEAAFIRLTVPAGARITENGIINSRFDALRHYQSRLKTTLPPIFADVSLSHIVPHSDSLAFSSGLAAAFSRPEDSDQRVAHLVRVARALPKLSDLAVVVTDADIASEHVAGFQQSIGLPVLIECKQRDQSLDAYFAPADGLLLHGAIHKSRALEPDSPPTIDMTRVEEIINRLRGVKPLSEMDPDIFLQR